VSRRSPKQRDIDDVEPAQDAVDDRPQDRMIVGIGDRDGERRAEAHAVLRALDPNPVVSISVHGDPFSAKDALVPRPPKREGGSIARRPQFKQGSYFERPSVGSLEQPAIRAG